MTIDNMDTVLLKLITGLISEAIENNGSVPRRLVNAKKAAALAEIGKEDAIDLMNAGVFGFERTQPDRWYLMKDFNYSPVGLKQLKKWHAEGSLVSNWVSLKMLTEDQIPYPSPVSAEERVILSEARALINDGVDVDTIVRRMYVSDSISDSAEETLVKVVSALGMIGVRELRQLTGVPISDILHIITKDNSPLKATNSVMRLTNA